MATPVPYRPEIAVGPTDRPIPYREVNTPVQAFGGATAAALSHLGDVTQQSGQELFQRAAAMQQLYQGADASAAASDYATKLAAAQSQYQTLEGKSAVDGLQPFVDQANSLRQDIRSNLQSPYAQLAFDQNSRFLQAWAMRGAGAYAAGQHKKFMLDTSNAEIGSAQSAALLDPSNDGSFQDGLARTNSAIDFQSQVHGSSPETTQYMRAKAVSGLWSNRIIGMAKTEPFAAQKLLEQSTQDGSLSGEDVAKVTAFVRNQAYGVGARNQASKIMSGNGLQFGEKVIPITSAQQAIGGYESHNDYSQIGPTTKAGDNGLGRYQVMRSNLGPWLAEAGMAPMTQAEFLASPAAQDKLFDFKFGQDMEQGGSFNAAVSKWFTGSFHGAMSASDAGPGFKGHTLSQYLIATNAILAQHASPQDLSNAIATQAEKLMPGDPMFKDYLTQHVGLLQSRQAQEQRQAEFQTKQTIDGALVKAYEGGTPITSIEQLTSNPQVATAWQSLQAGDQLEYIKSINQAAKGGVAWTPETQNQYLSLIGAAVDPNASPEERQELVQTDIKGMNIPMSGKITLMKLRGQVIKQQNASPQMSHALQVLAPMMNSASLTKSGDTTSYYQFLGALHEALHQQTVQSGGKPVTDQDIQVIGSRLMTNGKSTWSLNPFTGFSSDGAQLYASQPDSAYIQQITNNWQAIYGVDPTPDQIQTAYVAAQYRSLYSPGAAMKRAKRALAKKMRAAYE